MTDQPAPPQPDPAAAPTPTAAQAVDATAESAPAKPGPAPDTAGASPAAAAVPAAHSEHKRADRKHGVLAWILVFLLLVLVGLTGYGGWLGWQRYAGIEAERSAQLQQLQRLQGEVSALSAQVESLSTRQSDLSRLGDRQGTELAAQQARIDDGLQLMSRISADLSGGRTRFQLSSVEQLLLLANDRLLLHRDARSALAALDSADQRLAALSDPQLFPVREVLAAERNALRAVPQPDLTSATLSLSSLIERVPRLPLASHAPMEFTAPAARADLGGTTEQSPGWQRLWLAVQGAARSLFTVRRDDDARALRQLPPEQEALVYHVLTLKLEGARAALLGGRSVPMREALVSASAWLEAEFKADDAGVLAAQAELQRLQALELSPSLPDISGSLEALRAHLGDAE